MVMGRRIGGVTLKRVRVWSTPVVQAVSRMECMASWGLPKSSTRSPSREANIGPMVVPQGESFRTMRSWRREVMSHVWCVLIKVTLEPQAERA